MTFYRFYDMHSGGFPKIRPERTVYIEASSREVAVALFKVRFDTDPDRVTCPCCGPDFSVMDCEAGDVPSRYDLGKPLVILEHYPARR